MIAEDLALLRDGLERLLRDNGIEVVAAVADGDALVHAVVREEPDVAIVDVRLPPGFRDEGLRAALEVRRLRPATAILVVSQYVERAYAEELLADGRGGIGYLLKDRVVDPAAFVDAVRRVAEGGTALDPEVVARLVSRRRPGLERLTPRETEVLGLMAEGRSNAAIASTLVLRSAPSRSTWRASCRSSSCRPTTTRTVASSPSSATWRARGGGASAPRRLPRRSAAARRRTSRR